MKDAGGRLLAGVQLDRTGEQPLYRQLALQMRAMIGDGTLPPGARLPSTRTLISELGVSRATVVAAFEQLTAEGFLRARAGDGTYVDRLWGTPVPRRRSARPPLSERGAAVSARGGELYAEAPLSWSPREAESFVASQIAVDAFPVSAWRRLVAHRASRRELLGYPDAHGFDSLRTAVADYLVDVRGIDCDADQIVITSGAQQALNIIATLLLNPGDRVAVEDPGHIAGRVAFQAQGCRVVGVPVDDEGAVADAARADPALRLAYLTPARQHPLGMTMTPGRRAEWIGWAQRADAWIVEDDSDGELRYGGRLLPTLFDLDGADRVIHVGSFSKILAPSLRLGYVVLPRDLVAPFAAASSVLARPPATLMQAALADFLREGHLHAHLRRTRRLYSARQQALLEQLDTRMAGRLRASPVVAGLHVIGWLAGDVDDQSVARGLAARGVYTYALGDYRVQRRLPPALLIGFAGTAQEHMAAAVARMAAAFDEGCAAEWTGPVASE
ncbi:PLP-dependent aminotransferase family protein [Microbacterium capsulatum]|uniref:PLP-dependent aminotransferase family protein n=1 Tax=Microbacterium capsulatum TaxID=3041921 RepID=A0ABU0XGZ6_9MICO|nr:PLP-dependent aminotransferase family protein [Microbacterium sp. ASV81]MDQ4214405.1 PLP-dependent aminotransferase family protein [Microbacterium sp. ASV81]